MDFLLYDTEMPEKDISHMSIQEIKNVAVNCATLLSRGWPHALWQRSNIFQFRFSAPWAFCNDMNFTCQESQTLMSVVCGSQKRKKFKTINYTAKHNNVVCCIRHWCADPILC